MAELPLVSAREGRLWRGEAPLAGLIPNAYYLAEEASRGRVDIVDETLAAVRALGAHAVRTWAFNDDAGKRGDSVMQLGRGVLVERGLAGLDLVLARARAAGVYLVLPLVDHWSSYGGVQAYTRWAGYADAVEGDTRFYASDATRAHYAEWVASLLRRRNSITGVVYGEDPIVLAWELCNEPRGASGVVVAEPAPGALLADWVAFAARAVRRHARQLIAVGDEGHEVSLDGYDADFWRAHGLAHLFAAATRTSFSAHLAVPEVDLATCHFYPHKYGVQPAHAALVGARWIAEHARLARAAGKPLLVEEVGVPPGWLPPEERASAHSSWIAAARRDAAAIGPWLLTYRGRPRAWEELSFAADDPDAAHWAAAAR